MKNIKNFNNFINEYKSIDSETFNIGLDYMDINTKCEDCIIDSASANITYKIDLDFGKTGLKSIVPYNVDVNLIVTFENDIEKEFTVNNVDFNVENNELPFNPTTLYVEFKNMEITKIAVTF